MRTTGMPAAERNPASTITWAGLDLANVRTDFLRSVDLTRIPGAAARTIRAELAGRRQESRMA